MDRYVDWMRRELFLRRPDASFRSAGQMRMGPPKNVVARGRDLGRQSRARVGSGPLVHLGTHARPAEAAGTATVFRPHTAVPW